MKIKTANPMQDTGSQTKGALTRAAILDVSLELASGKGLEGLTIGSIAERMHMSKSGIFAHFGSREELQVEVVREYFRRFEISIFQPALKVPRGLPRLQRMLDLWMQSRIRELNSGCMFIAGAVEFDDCPGAVRDELVNSVQIWRTALSRAIGQAIEVGDLRRQCKPDLMLFQIYSVVLGLHHDVRFLKQPASIKLAQQSIQKIIDENRTPH
jgi:AcrR family transcriptional regulator